MKLGVLRILLGLIILLRFSEVTYSLLVLNHPSLIISYAVLLLIVFFIIGLCTPLVSFLLLFAVKQYDLVYHTSTLGTSILQIALLVFTLVNAGHYYSLDRYFLNRNSIISRLLRRLFNLTGCVYKEAITRAYFLAFIIYASISFAALFFHIFDYYWTSGLTTKSLLMNSYLCKHYAFFRLVEANIPYLLSIISILSSVFQSVFQFLMVPLIFFTLGN